MMNTLKTILLLGVILFQARNGFAGDTLSFFPMIQKTAYTNQKGEFSKGLWEPLSYGLNSRVEIQTHPLFIPFMPGLAAKIQYPKYGNNKLRLSSWHSLSYYTSWLKLWQGEGTGAILTPQIEVPTMFLIENGLFVSYVASPKVILSSNLNFSFIAGSKIDPTYTVDIPLVYPRFAPAFNGSVVSLKSNIQGKLFKNFQYLGTLDYIHINTNEFNNFIESSLSVAYAKSKRMRFIAGPKLIYGQYPFGNQFNLICYFNVVYTFGKK